jgi:hypothetical protein
MAVSVQRCVEVPAACDQAARARAVTRGKSTSVRATSFT